MKKIILGLMAVTLTISAMAQTSGNNSSGQNAERKEAKHDRKGRGQNYDNLNLTDAQKDQLKAINEDFKKQMQDLHRQGNMTVDEQKQKRQSLMQSHREKVESILTPEQKKQAQTMSKDFNGKGGRRGDRLDEITKNLNLTPDQSAKLSTLNTAFKNKMQDIRQNTSLKEDERKTQLKSLMKQHRSDMEALLTNEQKQQLKSQQRNRPNRDAVK